MPLDRTALLAPIALQSEAVEVPELGGSVSVRVMTGTERDRFEELHAAARYKNFRARFAVSTVCDAEGRLLFTEADIEAVGRMPFTALDRIYEVSKRLNGLTSQEVEALEKN